MSGPVPYSEWPSAGRRRRRRRLPVQRVHSRLAARVRVHRRSVQRAACAQRWTRPVGAHRTRQHVNCSCQVRKSARGLSHICAGTRPHLRRDCPTSAPGLAHICDGFGYTQRVRSHTHAWAHRHTRMSAPYQLGGCSRSALLCCSDTISSTTHKFWAFSTPRTRRCCRPFCRCAHASRNHATWQVSCSNATCNAKPCSIPPARTRWLHQCACDAPVQRVLLLGGTWVAQDMKRAT